MFRSVLVCIVSLCVVVVSWFYHVSVQVQSASSFTQARQSMVLHQHAEQRLARLNDALSSPLLSVLGEDLSAVQIRIAEYLTTVHLGPEDNQLVYEQSLLAHQLATSTMDQVTDTTVGVVNILRLDVQLRLAHTQKFLKLLKEIEVKAGGWPLEVRACNLQKIPMQLLDVRCVIDIYHWTTRRDEFQ